MTSYAIIAKHEKGVELEYLYDENMNYGYNIHLAREFENVSVAFLYLQKLNFIPTNNIIFEIKTMFKL